MSTKPDSLKKSLQKIFLNFLSYLTILLSIVLKQILNQQKTAMITGLVQYIQDITYQFFQLLFQNQNISPIAKNFLKN